MRGFEHGATDSGPDPFADFSTCAHPTGPCPPVLDAVLAADRVRYPDPAYTSLRDTLGPHHAVPSDQVVVGAGASELILRIVRSCRGGVLSWSPSFIEYRRAAYVCGRSFREETDQDAWLEALPSEGVAFLCLPNNPDGMVHDKVFLEHGVEAARRKGCRIVADLAYADFCRQAPEVVAGMDLLHAPNKKYGLTGIRAGYLLSSDLEFAERLLGESPSWVLGSEGVRFLESGVSEPALRWMEGSRAEVWRLADELRAVLAESGWETLASGAHFLAAQPPPWQGLDALASAGEWSRFLAGHGVRVRDLANVGWPGRFRLSARPPEELARLRSALESG
ncbi:MAG: histidinol-phosphate aminotransferase family protein [Fibrobacteria bacterium]|nr:histidinol-phosphate aminotransferase family protein [Fibrobacteria bacterium]